jgi:hypothetical protein
MWSTLSGLAGRRGVVLVKARLCAAQRGLLGLAVLCTAWHARAQDADAYAIRVESNQVLVPVFVFYKDRMKDDSPTEVRCLLSEMERNRELRLDEPFIPKDSIDTFFRGLTAKDFYLHEDDAQQTIQSVTFERFPEMDVRDNFGQHAERSSVLTGKWSTPDFPGAVETYSRYLYRLAYTPPKSPDGSCHSVKVVVNRPDSFVFARSQYCNVKHAPQDPLLGTAFGKRLETLAGSQEAGVLSASLQAGFFYADENRVRASIALDFPWDSLKRKWIKGTLNATIGVTGLVYSQDATLVARFSDFGCCSPDAPNFVATNGPHPDAFPQEDVFYIPARYETQIYLPPGDYDLRVVISDDSNFARVSVPLKIEPAGANQLAISSVMLCKRFRNAAVAAQEAAAVNLAPQYGTPSHQKRAVYPCRRYALPQRRTLDCLL